MSDCQMVTITIPMHVVRHIRLALRERGYTANLEVFNRAFWGTVVSEFAIPGWDLT